MFESILEWLFPLLIVCVIFAMLGLGITNAYYGSKQMRRIGAVHMTQYEDCDEAKRMLVGYIEDALRKQERMGPDNRNIGCSSLWVLSDSKEITLLIKKVHENGGRLVLRKKSDCDIECPENTELEVRKQLTDMDIRRAKAIESRRRR